MMRRTLTAVSIAAAAFGFAMEAAAKNPVSPAFDGNYIPRVNPVSAFSKADCQPFMVAPLTIAKGNLVSSGVGGLLNGIVTTDGFVTGYLLRPDKPRVVFEGRFVDGVFSGAVIDAACAYTVTLERAP
ncbi:MAG: hypothetical protein JNM81_15850 [Rhodospirillaceae bacterium]|nr:hypothetical protein [Rhodospirillaceae bacterium]